MFRRIVVAALLAGVIAGLALTTVQQLEVVPLILQAETYEPAAETAHDADDAHDHDHGGWAPDDGVERTLWTGVANVGMAFGFALLLTAIYSLRTNVGWREGLLWGLGGYAAFFALPAIGLTPELPGTETAALESRQVWWLMTVLLSAVGLAMLGLARAWWLKTLGLVAIVVPHAIGAPQPETHATLAPAELLEAFIIATALANAVFWAVLGTSSAVVFKKLA